MQAGRPFYYLPDMDYGQRDTIFAPFFGVDAATITGVSRLARLARARVLPCITRMLPGGEGYVVRFLPAWKLSRREHRGRHAAYERLHRGAGAGNAGAVSVGAQALQDPPGG